MDANHKSQQEVLHALGFYDGVIDGIWGPRTIQAKARFERDPKFVPGIPNHGLPFVRGHMLPFNLAWNDNDELYIKVPAAPSTTPAPTGQPVLAKPAIPGKPQIIARPAATPTGPAVTPVTPVTPVAAAVVAPAAPAVQAAPAPVSAPAAATAPAAPAAPAAPVDSSVASSAPVTP